MLHLLAQSFDYSYGTTTSSSDAASTSAALVLLMVMLIPIFVMAILSIIGMWKVFVKAGRPGWASIVPIYNTLVLLDIVGKPAWWIIGSFISPINILVAVLIGIELAKRFGKSEAFGVLALGLFAPIGYMIVGFGSAHYSDFNAPSAGAPTPPSAPMPPSPVA